MAPLGAVAAMTNGGADDGTAGAGLAPVVVTAGEAGDGDDVPTPLVAVEVKV